MGIVTKCGDKGKTALLTGEEVSKTSARCEAYGTADELNSFLGLARASLEGEGMEELAHGIRELQLDLLRFAGELAASDPAKSEWAKPTGEAHVEEVEERIAVLEREIKLPSSFIVPGATRASAELDVARSVARRLERRVVALSEGGEYQNSCGLKYVNRLSDYLFLMTRAVEKRSGIPFQTGDK